MKPKPEGKRKLLHVWVRVCVCVCVCMWDGMCFCVCIRVCVSVWDVTYCISEISYWIHYNVHQFFKNENMIYSLKSYSFRSGCLSLKLVIKVLFLVEGSLILYTFCSVWYLWSLMKWVKNKNKHEFVYHLENQIFS